MFPQTTYQHDYPSSRLNNMRYGFMNSSNSQMGLPEQAECQYVNTYGEPWVHIPYTLNADSMQWNATPRGYMEELRVMPTNVSLGQYWGINQDHDYSCDKTRPNRFYEGLSATYPLLPQRLGSTDELINRSMQNSNGCHFNIADMTPR